MDTQMKLVGVISATLFAFTNPAVAVDEGTWVQITSEIMDTWCYFSGVMGCSDAVIGTAHHTCALWCSAGGFPVGLLGDDGIVYMVLEIGNDDASVSGDTQLRLARHTVTDDGVLYERDRLNYLVVEEVIADLDIQEFNAEEYGTVPPFPIPKGER
jgi:hypothetical protein